MIPSNEKKFPLTDDEKSDSVDFIVDFKKFFNDFLNDDKKDTFEIIIENFNNKKRIIWLNVKDINFLSELPNRGFFYKGLKNIENEIKINFVRGFNIFDKKRYRRNRDVIKNPWKTKIDLFISVDGFYYILNNGFINKYKHKTLESFFNFIEEVKDSDNLYSTYIKNKKIKNKNRIRFIDYKF